MTADTSVIVPALSGWHAGHEAAVRALSGVDAAPAHALLESCSVMTRLPDGRARSTYERLGVETVLLGD